MNSTTPIKDITAVVCTFNSESTIERVLLSLQENGIEEIIVVDAHSEDKTIDLVKKYTNVILNDPREGLGKARNIGIATATKKYVVNVGSDNIMPRESIIQMLTYMIDHNYSGVSAQTFLLESKNYLSFALNLYKQLRYFPGERNVIGTPTLFETKLLIDNPYDAKMTWSDDGDLCTRLAQTGHKFAIADVSVYEIGSEEFSSIVTRWKMYGKSDWETYLKYSPGWTIKRKIKSLLYPLMNELILPLKKAKFGDKFAVLPFLLLILFVRYTSWIKWSLKK
jgi:glycosyltransferase involved in cell wall biosynthesis